MRRLIIVLSLLLPAGCGADRTAESNSAAESGGTDSRHSEASGGTENGKAAAPANTLTAVGQVALQPVPTNAKPLLKRAEMLARQGQ